MKKAAALLLLWAFLQTAATSASAGSAVIEKGRVNYYSGNYDLAALFLGEALGEGPFVNTVNYRMFYNTGLSLYMSGDYSQAHYVFSLLMEQYPSCPSLDRLALCRGLSALKAGRTADAYEDLRIFTGAFPLSTLVNQSVSALAGLEAGIYNEVQFEVSSPALFETVYNLGNSEFRSGNYRKGREFYYAITGSSYEREAPYNLAASSLKMMDALWQPAVKGLTGVIPGGMTVFSTFSDSGCFSIEGEKIFLNKDIEYLYNLGYYNEVSGKLKLIIGDDRLSPGDKNKYLKAAGFSAYYTGDFRLAYDCFSKAYADESDLQEKLSLLVKMSVACRRGGLSDRRVQLGKEFEGIKERLEAGGLLHSRLAGLYEKLYQ